MTITINNSSLLTSVSASQQDLENRVQSLEETTYEYEIFQLITSGTSGTVTIPTGSSVRLDQYPNAGDCLVVKVDSNNRPLDAPAVTSGSVVITSTFNSAGNYSLSGTPSSYPVAIIFQVSVAAKDVGNIALDSIVAVESVGLKNGGTVYGEIYIDDQNYGSVPLREGATQGMSTGVLSGGVLSITGGTTLQVTAGSGQVVNTSTTPNTYTPVTWGTLTATNSDLSAPFTHILISPNGMLIQQTSEPTMLQYIQNIYIGVVANVSGVQVASASRICSAASVGNQMQEFMRINGAINIKDAIKLSANGSNTQINSSAGNIWREGANANNSLATPNSASITAKTPLQFVQYYTNNNGDIVAQTALTSTLITNVYNNAGILTTIPVNKWQIIRIYMSPNGYGLLLTGSNIYNSLAAAESAIQNEQFVEPPLLADQAFIGWIIAKGQTVNLSNTTDNLIINATKYGVSGGSASTGYMLNTQYDPVGISEQLVGITATQTITNKTISGSTNTISNVPQSAITGLVTALDSKLDDTQATTTGLSVLGATDPSTARAAIGAGTSSFSGSYTDLTDKPTLGTASAKNVPATGDAASTEVVLGNDTRLTDTRSPVVYDQTKAYSTGQIVLVGSAVVKANAAIPANTVFTWGTTGATWSLVIPAGVGFTWRGVYTAGVSYITSDIVSSGTGINAGILRVRSAFTSTGTFNTDYETIGGIAVTNLVALPLGVGSTQNTSYLMMGASATNNGRIGNIPAPVAGQQNSLFKGDGTYSSYLTETSSGVGVGVTPSAWSLGSNGAALELSNTASAVIGVSGVSGIGTEVLRNAVYGASGWVYKTAGAASRFKQTGGIFSWHSAPSGTPDSAITWSQDMTLMDGKLGVGTTSPASKLDIADPSSDAIISLTATGVQRWQLKTERSTGNLVVYNQTNSTTPLSVSTAGVPTYTYGAKIGSDGTTILTKKLTGTTGAVGATATVATGIALGKIIGVQILVNNSGGGYMPHTYMYTGTETTNYYTYYIGTNGSLCVVTGSSATSVANRPFTAFITYEP